jgi:hypothetical protein
MMDELDAVVEGGRRVSHFENAHLDVGVAKVKF